MDKVSIILIILNFVFFVLCGQQGSYLPAALNLIAIVSLSIGLAAQK